MYVRKYLIFVIGMTAGIATMTTCSYLSDKQDRTDVESTQAQPAGPGRSATNAESPFAVVNTDTGTDQNTEATARNDTDDLSAFAQVDIEELIQRLETAENRINSLEQDLAAVQSQQLLPAEEALTETEQEDVLGAVFEPTTVSEIQAIRDDIQLQRLELRDLAIREGWINTDRFREESRALRSGSELRERLGDEGYDKLLAAEGRDNRVRIDSVIENSAADFSGLQEGDVVIRYADQRIFQFSDLRNGTTDGQRDESITIQVRRDGELLDLVIPRGPMGVTLSGVTEAPSP